MLTGLGYTPQTFASQTAFDAYIRSFDYQTQTKVCFGIDVSSSTGGTYKYALRFNMTQNRDRTDGPWTTLKLTEDRGIDLQLYSKTVTRGMLGANTLVHNAILQL